MNIKSTYHLRTWIKTQKAKDFDKNTDPNFIGSYYQDKGVFKKGFFTVLHGLKEDIPGYLPSILKIAEDGQAIYEFIQNAVDCGSTHFWIYYDEENFIAINNGHPFKQNEIASILNIAQSDKRSLSNKERCDKIGRFGIGFKLVHRLVGENDGTSELTSLENGTYKGPVIFSWSHYDQLNKFVATNEKTKQVRFDPENPTTYNEAPWLFKILLTNFPAAPGELVRDLKYRQFEAFPISELEEMKLFVREKLGPHLKNKFLLSKGTAFFLKLGKNKYTRLTQENEELTNGIQYGLNILKNLKGVTINETSISRKKIEFLNYEIAQSEEDFKKIKPEYEFCPIKISFGYHRDVNDILSLKSSPNFFKYFPLGDEVNQFAFIIHSDAFDIEANRRKIHKSERNIGLLEAIKDRLLGDLQVYCKRDKSAYLPLFSSILLSDTQENEKIEWINEALTTPLWEFIRKKVPTKSNKLLPAENVIIKAFKHNISLSEVGIPQKDWYKWTEEESEEMVDHAYDGDKLDLAKWYLRTLVVEADAESLNSYFEDLPIAAYQSFINELSKEQQTKDLKGKLNQLSWIKSENATLCTINNIHNGIIWVAKDFRPEIQEIFTVLGKETVHETLLQYVDFLSDINQQYYTKPEVILQDLKSEGLSSAFLNLSAEQRFQLVSYLGEFKEISGQLSSFPFIKSKDESLAAPNMLINTDTLELGKVFSQVLPAEDEVTLISEFDFAKYLISEAQLSYEIHKNGSIWETIKPHIGKEEIASFYSSLVSIHSLRNPKLADNALTGTQTACIDPKGNLSWVSNASAYYLNGFEKLNRTEYDELASAILDFGDFPLPVYGCLSYYKQIAKPESKDGLAGMITSGKIVPKEILEFIVGLNAKVGKGKFFNELYVTETPKGYIVKKKAKGEGVFNFLSIEQKAGNQLELNGILLIPFYSKLSESLLKDQGLL